ncbi:CU044_5270 family protein [Micromonospora peucetia]|uniref:CU044_5270 family protein n=1 Tax=Micromonospora peucetia TaxID=47871 RepID=A0A1C6TV86_9ACTN|nr:CU044_5270 family protein [Micromonospora peucetia]SCL45588.1 hypothetical protein GA0070608_0031 [Micromonospora peucetia]
MKIDKNMLKQVDPARDVDDWPVAPHVDWSAMARNSPPASIRRQWTRRAVLGAVAASATAIAGALVVQVVGPAKPVLAVTPPPLHLQYDKDAPAASDALLKLASAVQAGPAVNEQRSGRFSFVRVGQWSLDMSSSAKDGTAVAVVPQVISTWRALDGSGKVVTASLHRSDVGDKPDAQALMTAATRGGTQVSTYAAGQLAAVIADPIPHDVDALAKALYAHQPQDKGAQSAVRAIADLYRAAAVDRDVRVAALRFLARTDGVLLRGEITDRLGRRGLAVSVDSKTGETRDLLVFDQRTGLLLAHESMFLKRPEKLPVKVPAVFSYVLYLEQDRRTDMT